MEAATLDLLVRAVQASATVAGVIIAGRGLATWKRQIAGQHAHELARRIAVSVYTCRNSLQDVRNPAMDTGELESAMPADTHHASDVSNALKSHQRFRAAYGIRWKRLVDARLKLDVELVEAEAVWGTELRGLIERLDDIHRAVYFAILKYLDAVHPTSLASQHARLLERVDPIVFRNAEQPDRIDVQYASAVSPIEQYLRRHLRAS